MLKFKTKLATLSLLLGLAGTHTQLAWSADDPWTGLDEAIDEAKLEPGKDEEMPDFSELKEESESATKEAEGKPAGNTSQASKPPTPRSPAPTPPAPAAKLSPEEQIRAEYESYAKRKREVDEEGRLRQSVFHEGAKNIFSLVYRRDDLATFRRPRDSGRGKFTNTVGLSYDRVLARSRRLGHIGVGLGIAGTFTDSRTSKAQMAFYSGGIRLQGDLQFSVLQLLIPTGFIGYEHVKNLERNANPESTAAERLAFTEDFNTLVYGGGLILNLNRLDMRTGTQALVSTGIKRFGIALMYHQRQGDSPSRTSGSFHASIRFEN